MASNSSVRVDEATVNASNSNIRLASNKHLATSFAISKRIRRGRHLVID